MTSACPNRNRAFRDHGVPDGVDLVHRARYRLLSRGDATFSPDDEFFERLQRAFRTAFVRANRSPSVPASVEAALDDAGVATAEAFDSRPDADLRRVVLPAFYREFADWYCRYWRGDSGGVQVRFVDDGDGDEDDGGIVIRQSGP